MLYLSNKLNYLTQEQSEKLINKSNEVGKIIRGLIKSISLTANN
jgi:four helix bundle protein